ncbi:hypothetical protein FRC01_005549, partial [Tulasnella sp. 417]
MDEDGTSRYIPPAAFFRSELDTRAKAEEEMQALARYLSRSALIEVPHPLEVFGQDGGEFYRCYDELAEEIDDDMAGGLREQLDGLLLFNGLFAGINSAFLALTLPLLTPNPVDDTNALLLRLTIGGNFTYTAADLPSAYFTPSYSTVLIVALFSMTLATTLVSSFIAVQGKQWLVYYRKRRGGGSDHQRWDQLRRFLGAQRWALELILDDALPSVLQVSLAVFCIALVLYVGVLNRVAMVFTVVPLLVGLVCFVGSALARAKDKFCPFRSHLSNAFLWVADSVLHLLTSVKESFPSFSEWLQQALGRPDSNRCDDLEPSSKYSVREEESVPSLQVLALQRAVCISEDPATLLCAMANVPAIVELTQLRKLWEDNALRETLLELYRSTYTRNLQLRGNRGDLALRARRVYAVAITHFIFYLDLHQSGFERLFPLEPILGTERFKDLDIWDSGIPREFPHLFIQTHLVHLVMSISLIKPSIQEVEAFCDYLTACSDVLMTPNWRFFCFICWIVAQLPKIGMLYSNDRYSMSEAFRGLMAKEPKPTKKDLLRKTTPTAMNPLDEPVTFNSIQPLDPSVAANWNFSIKKK